MTPSSAIEFLGARDKANPLKFELRLVCSYLNIDRDAVIGTFSLKEIDAEIARRTTGVTVELLQQEIQGATKQSMHPPDNMVGNRLATIPGQAAVS